MPIISNTTLSYCNLIMIFMLTQELFLVLMYVNI